MVQQQQQQPYPTTQHRKRNEVKMNARRASALRFFGISHMNEPAITSLCVPYLAVFFHSFSWFVCNFVDASSFVLSLHLHCSTVHFFFFYFFLKNTNFLENSWQTFPNTQPMTTFFPQSFSQRFFFSLSPHLAVHERAWNVCVQHVVATLTLHSPSVIFLFFSICSLINVRCAGVWVFDVICRFWCAHFAFLLLLFFFIILFFFSILFFVAHSVSVLLLNFRSFVVISVRFQIS